MKIYETSEQAILVDKAVEYFNAIKKNYDFAQAMQGAVQNRFMRETKQIYEQAKENLLEKEARVLDRILVANDINLQE